MLSASGRACDCLRHATRVTPPPQVLEAVDKVSPHHELRDQLVQLLNSHAAAMLNVQDSSGAWHQVLNETDTFLETSVTAMTMFSFARGIARGASGQGHTWRWMHGKGDAQKRARRHRLQARAPCGPLTHAHVHVPATPTARLVEQGGLRSIDSPGLRGSCEPGPGRR